MVTASSGSQGGGEFYLLKLAEELVALGHSVGLAASSHSRMDGLAAAFGRWGAVFRWDYRNTYDYRFRALHYLLPTPSVGALDGVVRQFQAEAILLNKQNLEDGLDLVRWAGRQVVPVVGTIHITQTMASLGAPLGILRDAVAAGVLRRRRFPWIAVSEARGRDLRSFLGSRWPGRIEVIGNGVSVPSEAELQHLRETQRAVLGLRTGQRLYLSVGRLHPQKDPLRWVALARELHREEPEARFIWVGDGMMRVAFEAALSEAGLGGVAWCVGWQSEVAPFLAAADACLHPASYEGMAFSVLEYLAYGKPCAVTSGVWSELPAELQPWVVGGLEAGDGVTESASAAQAGSVAQGRSSWRCQLAKHLADPTYPARVRDLIAEAFSARRMATKTLGVFVS